MLFVLPKISTKIRNSGHVLTDFFTQFSTDFSQTHPAPRSLRLLPNHLLVPVLLPKICATATNWGLCWIVTKSRCFQRPCLGFVRALWVEISCSEGTHGAQSVPYRGGSCWKRPGEAQSPPKPLPQESCTLVGKSALLHTSLEILLGQNCN